MSPPFSRAFRDQLPLAGWGREEALCSSRPQLLFLCLPVVGTHSLGAVRTKCSGTTRSGSQAWGLTIQATAVVEPIQRGWNKRGGPRAVGEPDGPSHQCKEHRGGLVMGEELTRESPLLRCLGDVRSETGRDWGTGRGVGRCF